MIGRLLRRVALLLFASIFLLGFSILTYPFINNWFTAKQMRQEASSFYEIRETLPSEPAREDAVAPEIPYAQLLEAMQSYNETIFQEEQSGLSDPWAYVQSSFSLGGYGLEEDVFGVIQIPKLDLEMPIYLGASSEHLASGAAHLTQTSLPIGGNNTCCVIAGHRGWKGAAYFRYVPELLIGDSVRITNLWETLNYTVVGTKIITPNDVDTIKIQPDRELLILLTCHPYASGGKQRFLVICERSS